MNGIFFTLAEFTVTALRFLLVNTLFPIPMEVVPHLQHNVGRNVYELG